MREVKALLLVSLVTAAGSLAGAVWVVASGQLTSMDGLFLLISLLWLSVVFALLSRYVWRKLKNAQARSRRAGPPEGSIALPAQQPRDKIAA